MAPPCRRWRWAAPLILAAAGCTNYVLTPMDPSGRMLRTVPASLAHGIFDYSLPVPGVTETPRPGLDERDYQVSELRFASVGDNAQPGQQVQALFYRGRAPGPLPVLIVLPLWGTHTYPPEKIAQGLRARNDGAIHVLRLLGENYLFDWDALARAEDPARFFSTVADMPERMRVTVIDIRRLIDWLSARPEVAPDRLGLIGFSMSSVIGALVLGADARLRTAVMIMGGAHPEKIIARCDGPLADVRKTLLPRFGWQQDEYEAHLEKYFDPVDPANYPARIDPARILMVDSLYDDCMPVESRDAYWNALGRPRRISFRYTHKQSFLALTPLGLNTMRRQIYRHVDETL